ncbi:MAG: hypothetical protein H7287_00195 [Thermoleophilia bacterium]|nr:hypothetical protein [Thermoleophilia bacterium]
MFAPTLPSDLLRALVVTLRSQLIVAAISAVAIGAAISLLVEGHVDAGIALAGWVVASVALTTASALVVFHPDGAPWKQLPVRALRALTQLLVCCAPLVGLLLLTRLAAREHAVLGLLLVPLAFVAAALVLAPALLSIASAAAGDASWLPGRSCALVRARPWRFAGGAIVALVLVGLVMLPGVLGGLLLTALLGPLGAIGYGMGAAVSIPALGSTLTLVWRSLDDSTLQGGDDAYGVEPVLAGWVAGPTWQATFDERGRWGAWLQMPTSGSVAVRLARPLPGLQLMTHGPDGAWTEFGAVGAPGQAPVIVALAAGATWLHVHVAPGAVVPAGVVEVGVLAPAAAAA